MSALSSYIKFARLVGGRIFESRGPEASEEAQQAYATQDLVVKRLLWGHRFLAKRLLWGPALAKFGFTMPFACLWLVTNTQPGATKLKQTRA